MQGKRRIQGMKLLLASAGTLLPLALSVAQQPPMPVPPGTPVTITVTQAAPAAPPASFTLGPRHGHVTPQRHGCTHTGGGNIDVAQPSPDTLVITMSGVAVAYGAAWPSSAAQTFDLDQAFEINFDNPKLKKAKLTLEGRVIGLLRTHGCKDTAGFDNACASVLAGQTTLLNLCVPSHTIGGGENLSVNDHNGPVSVPIAAGRYCLHQTFTVSAVAHPCLLVKGPSAEFAPDPALDPLWISYKEPFHGAAKKDFGFQATLKVAEDTAAAAGEGEKIPTEPKKVNNDKP